MFLEYGSLFGVLCVMFRCVLYVGSLIVVCGVLRVVLVVFVCNVLCVVCCV